MSNCTHGTLLERETAHTFHNCMYCMAAEIDRLREALQQIADGNTEFSGDPTTLPRSIAARALRDSPC